MRPTSLPAHLRLVEVVGRGATGETWRARDRRRGRDVAVKVVRLHDPDGPMRRARFEAEVRAMARLAAHPHVADVVAAGIDDAAAWTVMPLADGSVADRIAAGEALDVLLALSMGESIADALDTAHALEVVHGDVTPANVLLQGGSVLLADFGSADVQPAAGTAPSAATPAWAAPEVLDGEPSSRASDVYGLGATLWSAATARPLVPGEPPDVAELPRGLAALVAACCDPDPTRRPSAQEARRAATAELRRRSRYCPDP